MVATALIVVFFDMLEIGKFQTQASMDQEGKYDERVEATVLETEDRRTGGACHDSEEMRRRLDSRKDPRRLRGTRHGSSHVRSQERPRASSG